MNIQKFREIYSSIISYFRGYKSRESELQELTIEQRKENCGRREHTPFTVYRRGDEDQESRGHNRPAEFGPFIMTGDEDQDDECPGSGFGLL